LNNERKLDSEIS